MLINQTGTRGQSQLGKHKKLSEKCQCIIRQADVWTPRCSPQAPAMTALLLACLFCARNLFPSVNDSPWDRWRDLAGSDGNLVGGGGVAAHCSLSWQASHGSVGSAGCLFASAPQAPGFVQNFPDQLGVGIVCCVITWGGARVWLRGNKRTAWESVLAHWRQFQSGGSFGAR